MASDSEVTIQLVDAAAASGSMFLLKRYLGGRDAEVRRHAALKLEELGDPRAVDALIKALGDTDAAVVGRVASALGSLRDPKALGPLRAATSHESPDVQAAATKAIEAITRDPRTSKDLRDARKEVKRGRKQAKKQVVADAIADVARLTHATIRFRPPSPGLTGTVRLPDVCVWCGERVPSSAVERELQQKHVSWTEGSISKSLSVDLRWSVSVPYCAECRPRADSRPATAARRGHPLDAVHWGHCVVGYTAMSLESHQRVPAWVESLELVFLNAAVAERVDAEYRNLEVQRWSGELWQGGFKSGLSKGPYYYGYASFPDEHGLAQVLVRAA